MKGLTILTIFSALAGWVAADGEGVTLTAFHQSTCVGKNGVFLPLPESCSEYLICVDGVAILGSCGANHFDPRRLICDIPARAGCISIGPLPLPSAICSGHPDGEKLPMAGDRSKYYECTQGTAIVRSCGSVIFDEVRKGCVNNSQPALSPCFGVANAVSLPIPGNLTKYYFCMNNKAIVKDCGAMYFDAKHSACVPINSSSTVVEPSSPCSGVADGFKLPVDGSLTQYYLCMNNKAIVKDCGAMYFDAKHSACVPINSSSTVVEPSSPCSGVADGFKLPVDGSLTQYYICMNNKAFLKDCGAMHFDAKHSACVPLNSSSTVVEPSSPCSGVADGVKLPVDGSLTQYHFCMNNKAFLEDCGAMHFDAIHSACVPINSSSTVVEPPSPCSGVADGVKLPVDGSLTQYHFCMNNKAFLEDCGAMHFDAIHSACVPINSSSTVVEPPSPCSGVADGVKLPVDGSLTQYHFCMNNKAFLEDCGAMHFDAIHSACVPLNSSSTVVEPPSPCSGVADGVKLPVDGSLTQYHFCMHNKAFLKDCGHMYFDAKHSACVLLVEKEVPTTVLPPQTPPSQDPVVQKACRNQRIGARVAVPGSCSEYFICTGNTAIVKSCNSMQFNPITASCDLPSNVHCSIDASGLVYGKDETPLVVNEIEISTTDQLCEGQRDGIFVPVPGNCSIYYFCFRYKAFLKTCGKRHFNPITLSCVELEQSICVDSTFVKPIPDAIPTVTINNCHSRENGALMRHPTQCGKYIICDNNVPVEMPCPAGLHFNSERNYCDWPELAHCI